MQKERDVLDLAWQGVGKRVAAIISFGLLLVASTNVHADDCLAIEFVADQCHKCDQMRLATDRAIEDGWVVRRYNVNRDQHIAARWRINNVPTTIVVRNGQEVDRLVGPVGYEELKRRLENATQTSKTSASQKNIQNATIRGQSPLAAIPVAMSGAMTASQPRIDAADSVSAAHLGTSTARDPQESSVRIRVSEQQQESVGSGTVIDVFQGEALVLTCGHLFRDSQGKATVTVETFVGGKVQSYPATVIDFQAKEVDIGLLSFRPHQEIPAARLIPITRKLSESQKVFSIGCDHGAPPTRRDSRITKLNRYLGPANVEVEGQPAEGRSGGGLFDERGELIGVCYAADPRLGEGLYNGAEVVYQQLAKLGLQRLFHEEKRQDPVQPPQSRISENTRPTDPRLNKSQVFSDSADRHSSDLEMTVILKDVSGKQELIHIPNPSDALLRTVRENFRQR